MAEIPEEFFGPKGVDNFRRISWSLEFREILGRLGWTERNTNTGESNTNGIHLLSRAFVTPLVLLVKVSF